MKFFSKYIDTPNSLIDEGRYSFLLGYYFHFFSDIEWDKMHKSKRINDSTYDKNLKDDPKFIWEIKKDWYGLDFLYLKENKSSIFYNSFMRIDKVNDYLDYFSKGAFERQVKYITNFCLENIDKEDENREFPYLTKEEMDAFVGQTTEIIDRKVREKNLDKVASINLT